MKTQKVGGQKVCGLVKPGFKQVLIKFDLVVVGDPVFNLVFDFFFFSRHVETDLAGCRNFQQDKVMDLVVYPPPAKSP